MGEAGVWAVRGTPPHRACLRELQNAALRFKSVSWYKFHIGALAGQAGMGNLIRVDYFWQVFGRCGALRPKFPFGKSKPQTEKQVVVPVAPMNRDPASLVGVDFGSSPLRCLLSCPCTSTPGTSRVRMSILKLTCESRRRRRLRSAGSKAKSPVKQTAGAFTPYTPHPKGPRSPRLRPRRRQPRPT